MQHSTIQPFGIVTVTVNTKLHSLPKYWKAHQNITAAMVLRIYRISPSSIV